MKFNEFNVSDDLITDLKKHDIINLTPVQEQAIPHILNERDLLVQSKTGSGKTIGFAVPTIENIEPKGDVQILVITPTRELARQVGKEYMKFSKTKGLKTVLVYGGVSVRKQSQKVGFADIIVGTPGRLLDLLYRKVLKLDNVEYLVIDEADRLMDMGFIDDINKILNFTPKNKQSILCSATINSRVLKLKDKYLNNPAEVILNNKLKNNKLEQYYYNVRKNRKLSLLTHLLRNEDTDLVLVFCNMKRTTRFVAKVLKYNGIKAACMNGDMSQHSREKTIKKFIEGKIKVLVATDVAARGLHVDNITHVINYNLPHNEKTYTHRVGRTARNGKEGKAIILLSSDDFREMDKIKNIYRGKINESKASNYKKVRIPSRKR